jgi:steroid delta-isomerase-like uncharacterized protein
MSLEQNKSRVLRYVEQVLNEGKFEAFKDRLSPNYRRQITAAAAALTADEQKKRLAGIRAAFPDIHLTVEDVIAEGDRVAFRMTLQGTHQGMFQGIPATNKQVMVTALDVIRIENGRISEHWGGPDMVAILQQIGAVVSAGPEKK